MLSLLSILILAVVVLSQRDAEESMTSEDLIRHWGYSVESHDVITEDGYILNMLRIPHGRRSGVNDSCHRPPVLFAHGLLSDSAEFVENPPESSPAMILANAGYDVFLLNHRGTTNSQRHVRLNRSDPEFWKFSLDEFAKYDAPAVIDKALELNAARSLYWVGHSQGTIIGFFLLAERPEYNQKVRAVFQLAPVGTLHYAGTFGKALAWTLVALRQFLIAPREIGFHIPWLVGGVTKMLCSTEMSREICKTLVQFVLGPPSKSLNFVRISPKTELAKIFLAQTRLPLYLGNFFVSTSSWTLLQIGENGYYNHANHYNGSPEDNLRRYGNIIAPPFNYSNINTDFYLFWSRNDWLTTPKEVDWLMQNLKPGVIKGTFEIPEYNHADYAAATDVGESVFSKINKIVGKYEWIMCNS